MNDKDNYVIHHRRVATAHLNTPPR